MILAGDIGGTSSRLALFKNQTGRIQLVSEQTFPSQRYAGLDDIAQAFARSQPYPIRHACFGIAGPVQEGRVVTPNLAWVVDARSLARNLGLPEVRLINDLEANAYGIAALEPEDFVWLNTGAANPVGNGAVISVGTGLGEAGLFWDGAVHRPYACEGGHADFSPRDELETELLLHLRAKFGHVSYERVLSGPGLYNIYQFLRDTHRGEEPAALAQELREGDPSVVITKAGLAGRYELCARALDLFVSFYGAEAGNLALKTMATGGVFVGGGIAPKIIKKLQGGGFMEAFVNKGRMRPLLQAMPVRVILKESTALLGAARCAAQLA